MQPGNARSGRAGDGAVAVGCVGAAVGAGGGAGMAPPGPVTVSAAGADAASAVPSSVMTILNSYTPSDKAAMFAVPWVSVVLSTVFH